MFPNTLYCVFLLKTPFNICIRLQQLLRSRRNCSSCLPCYLFPRHVVIYVRVLLEIQGMKSTNMSSTHRPGQSKKAIKTTLLLLGTYFLCIGPQWVATLAVPSDAQKLRSRTNAILLCILLMNCVCDPLIYSLRMRDVKQGYDKLISICKLKNAVRDQTPCDVITYGR